MIGEHLYFRCKKGCYDDSTAAGMKTAAVSPSFSALPKAIEHGLDNYVTKYAVLPDNLEIGGGENRGILRISHVESYSVISRLYRVRDLCDSRGTVCFSHSYILEGEDRGAILRAPGALCDLNNFEQYSKVDERCGGIGNANEITFDSNISIHPSDTIDYDEIFSGCHVDAGKFSYIMMNLCSVLSKKLRLFIILPEVDSSSWSKHGGSERGERFLLSLLSLLPDCLARFFSGVSYWNESYNFYGLEDLNIFISSGNYTSQIYEDVNALVIDLTKNDGKYEGGVFGELIWKLRNDKEKLSDFLSFIDNTYGKNVDLIKKLPSLMNAVTIMYLYPEADRREAFLASTVFLSVIGKYIERFPKIYEYTKKSIRFIYENHISASKEFQTVMLNYENPDEVVFNLLMGEIAKDNTTRKIIQFFVEKLIKDNPSAQKLFSAKLDEIEKAGLQSISYSTLELILKYYVCEERLNDYVERTYKLLIRNAAELFTNRRYDEFLETAIALIKSKNTLEIICRERMEGDMAAVAQQYGELFTGLILLASNREYSGKVKSAMFQHIKILISDKKYFPFVNLFEAYSFENRYMPDLLLSLDMDFFGMFIISSPFLKPDELEKWRETYLQLLSENYTIYSESDKYLTMLDDQRRMAGLYNNEIMRKKSSGNVLWSVVNEIVVIMKKTFPNTEAEKRKRCQLVFNLSWGAQNVEEFIRDMSECDMIYEYFLILSESKSPGDEMKQYVNTCLKYLLMNDDCFEKLIAYAIEGNHENVLVNRYYSWWLTKYNPYRRPVNRLDIEQLIFEIKHTEKLLTNDRFRIYIMKQFGNLFSSYFDEKCIVSFIDTPPVVISFINYGMKRYNWEKFVFDKNMVKLLQAREVLDRLMDTEKTPQDEDMVFAFSQINADAIRPFQQNLYRYLKNIFDKEREPLTDNYALLALLYVRFISGSSKKYFANYLCALSPMDSSDGIMWYSEYYLMLGLKYLNRIESLSGMSQKISSIKESFVEKFVDLMGSASKDNVMICADEYSHNVKAGLNRRQIYKISGAARRYFSGTEVATVFVENRPKYAKD